MTIKQITSTLAVRQAKLAKGERITIPVKGVTGLHGTLSAKSKLIHTKLTCPSSGKRERVVFGDLMVITVDEAKRQFYALTDEVKKARRNKQEITLAAILHKIQTGEALGQKTETYTAPDIFETYYNFKAKLKVKKNGKPLKRPEVIKGIFEDSIFPYIFKVQRDANGQIIDKGLPLHELTTAYITERITSIYQGTHIPEAQKAKGRRYGGKEPARKVLIYLLAFMNWAKKAGYCNPNPIADLTEDTFSFPKIKRARFLYREELPPLFDTLKKSQMDIRTSLAINILLRTGVRVLELTLAEWKHVNLSQARWFIPAANTKSQEAIAIPLPTQVIELMSQLKAHTYDSGLVLGGMARHVPTKALGRLQAAGTLKLEAHLTTHDLRRSFATFMADLGTAPHIIEQCLNHSLARHHGDTAGVYNRSDLFDERAEAMQKLSDALENPLTALPYKPRNEE